MEDNDDFSDGDNGMREVRGLRGGVLEQEEKRLEKIGV